jgi:hypothetical protein
MCLILADLFGKMLFALKKRNSSDFAPCALWPSAGWLA